MAEESSRIQWMDGLRGIAILCVIAYHYYGAEYAAYMPFGSRYSAQLLPRFGWLGVELFFLISGFVILMTLERSSGLLDFALRRWLRLFPGMLIASLIAFIYDRTVGVGPDSARTAFDLIPGLTFLSPALIHTLTRIRLVSMDGPYWSLYVEVVFYAVFGTAFFLKGWKFAVATILGLFAATYALEHSGIAPQSLLGKVASAADWLGFVFFCWFAAGAIFYRASKARDERLFWLATAIAFIAAVTQKHYSGAGGPIVIAAMMVATVFSLAQRSAIVQRICATRALVFVGFVSYPLYLIHSNIGIGLTHILAGHFSPGSALWVVPLIPLSVIVGAAWVIARYGEPTLKSLLDIRRRPPVRAAAIDQI